MKRELDDLITQMHSAGIPYTEAVRQFKKRYILEVLAQHKGNQCKAAEELGMHRNTLSRTLAELDMDTAQIRNGILPLIVVNQGAFDPWDSLRNTLLVGGLLCCLAYFFFSFDEEENRLYTIINPTPTQSSTSATLKINGNTSRPAPG